MNVGIGIEAVQFLSWEYLFRIFAIVSLQCGSCKVLTRPAMHDFSDDGRLYTFTIYLLPQ
jgi:hypothetical protein